MESTPYDSIIQSLESLVRTAPKGADISLFARFLEELRAKRTCTILDIPDSGDDGPNEGYGNFETWAAAEWVTGSQAAREHWGSLATELLHSLAPERAVRELANRLCEAHASKTVGTPLFPMPDVDWGKIAFLLVDLADSEDQQLEG